MNRPGFLVVVFSITLIAFGAVANCAHAQVRPAGTLAPLAESAVVNAWERQAHLPFSSDRSTRSVGTERQGASTAALLAAGIAGGAVGLVGGAYLGAALDHGGSEYLPVGAVIGGLAGETLLLPLAVHLANGRRGNLLNGTLLSVAAMGAGILFAAPTGAASMLAVPPVQLYLSITEEQR
jgi:hypothetical protein